MNQNQARFQSTSERFQSQNPRHLSVSLTQSDAKGLSAGAETPTGLVLSALRFPSQIPWDSVSQT